ncbi:hypothetical protein [Leptothrix discophora]|uniref:Lipoprotein n=1 Tax=Leptothrix discophora TaxID=89 RepID=A0ABT9G6D7_LEPDI|nr:hypothetical protein [Leptothrix discophora]MDP4301976.1 hypothetical protein [Leptothrix discophora]
MIITRLKCAVSLFIVFAIGGCASTPTTTKPAKVAAQKAALPPIVLSPGFTGQSCKNTLAEMRRIAPPRDQFEKTSDYDARIKASLNAANIAGQQLNAPMIFLNGALTKYAIKYDADSETLRVSMETESALYSIGTSYAKLRTLIVDRTTKMSEYTGSNAFGATKTITKTENEICGVALTNSRSYWPDGDAIQLKASATQARNILQNAGMALEIQLSPPYTAYHLSGVSPKIDFPYESTTSGNVLVGQVIRIVLFDKVTGQVFVDHPWPN